MILFLYGPDTFRSREKLREIKEKFLKEIDPSGINLETLDGARISMEKLENAFSTMPFLAKKRMVIIENLLSSKLHAKHADALVASLEKKSEKDAIVVFWEGAIDEAKAKKNALFQYLIKQKYQYPFHLLSPRELQYWIKQKISQLNGSIDPLAAVHLADIVGDDLWFASSEITKLVMYAHGRPITVNDIQTMSPLRLEENIFLLTDALGQKNKKLAVKLIRDQIESGMTETELLHKCFWHFKNLLLIKSSLNEGQTRTSYELAQALGIHPFVAKKGMAQANNFSIDKLKNMYKKLLDIDRAIKTSRTRTEVLFDLLVMDE